MIRAHYGRTDARTPETRSGRNGSPGGQGSASRTAATVGHQPKSRRAVSAPNRCPDQVVPARRLAGKRLRVGAYGDPGAVPLEIWDEVLARVRELNSYTHLWRENPALSAFCMASCDNEEEHRAAKALGFRVYRVRPEGAPVLKGEGRCPASKEMGKTVQCSACMLCGGQRTGAKADITIVAHGRGAKQFSREMAA